MTRSAEETIEIGKALGKSLPPNSIVCFFGDLAAGKTTLVKGIVAGAVGYPVEEVSSPTFVYLNIYNGVKPVYHFDLYRIHDPDEFFSMGFQEFFETGGICCIEWSERIQEFLPPETVHIHLEHLGPDCRKVRLCLPFLSKNSGKRGASDGVIRDEGIASSTISGERSATNGAPQLAENLTEEVNEAKRIEQS